MTSEFHLKGINHDYYVINFGIENNRFLLDNVVIYGMDMNVYTIKSESIRNKREDYLAFINEKYIPFIFIEKWVDVYGNDGNPPYIYDIDIRAIQHILRSSSEEEKASLPLWFKEMLILEELKK